jgi:hypothetical protein
MWPARISPRRNSTVITEVNAFIDEHRARCGVEPICRALQVALSAYRRHAAYQRDPALLPHEPSVMRASLLPPVQRVYEQNLQVYGADTGLAPAEARRHGSGALRRRAVDAPALAARRASRIGGANHRAECKGGLPAEPREPAVQGRRPNRHRCKRVEP